MRGNHTFRADEHGLRRSSMRWVMPVAVAALLSACASVSIDEPAPGAPPAPEVDILAQPLKVPPLDTLRDTPERSIDVQWSADAASTADGAGYPVDLLLQTTNRPGLLRDITELFARDKMPVIGMQTEPGKGVSHMTLTVQVANTNRLRQTLAELCKIEGIVFARRRH